MLFRNIQTDLLPLASLELCSMEMFSFLFHSYFRNPQFRDRKRRKHSNNTEIIFPFYYLKITPVRGKKKKSHLWGNYAENEAKKLIQEKCFL